MSVLAVGSEGAAIKKLQQDINAFLGTEALDDDGKFGRKTYQALRSIQERARRTNRDIIVDGRAGRQTAVILAGRSATTGATSALAPTGGRRGVQTSGRREATQREEAPARESSTVQAPPRRARGGGLDIGDLRATGPRLGVPHITQPTPTSCKPTTERMIRAAGGRIGKDWVGPGDNMRLDGSSLRRLLTQLQSSGVMAGVRARNDNGSIRGDKDGHVVALTGYQFVDRSGRQASDATVRAAVAGTGGDWNRLLGELSERGLHLRLNLNDPGLNPTRRGHTSYLDVAPNGRMSRPAIGDRMPQGNYTVRYLMLD